MPGVIRIPRWLAAMHVLAAGVLTAAVAVPALSFAGGNNLSVMPVSAIVQPSAVVKFVVVPINISISTADIARGYIDVPVGSLLSVKSGQALPPVIIDFSMGDGLFKSVEVRERDSAKVEAMEGMRRTDLAAGGGDDRAAQQVKKASSTNEPLDELKKTDADLSTTSDRSSSAFAYRFRLSDKAKPGSYQVPVVLNITF